MYLVDVRNAIDIGLVYFKMAILKYMATGYLTNY